MKRKIIIEAKGKPVISEFDKSFYTEDHDVPALYINGQIIAIGNGIDDWNIKDKEHLRWKLDKNKTYKVTIEEI